MQLSEDFWLKAVRLLHNILIMIDDLLCEEFNLVRQGRRKFDN